VINVFYINFFWFSFFFCSLSFYHFLFFFLTFSFSLTFSHSLSFSSFLSLSLPFSHFVYIPPSILSLDLSVGEGESVGKMGNKMSAKIRTMAEKGDVAGLQKAASNAKINDAVLNDPGADGCTAMILAAKNGHGDCVKLLIEAGADPYLTDNEAEGAITHAAMNGNKEVIEAALASGKFDINREPLPLIAAADAGEVDMVKFLLQKGANASQLTGDSRGALIHAVTKQNVAVVKVLLDAGANPNNGSIMPHARFPLQACVSRLYMNQQITSMILDAGADINFADKNKWTALHQAVSDGSVKVTGFLMEHGANPKAEDSNGKTPMDLANDMYDDKNIIHAQLSGEVVDMNQEAKVWSAVNQQDGGYGGPSGVNEHFG